MDVSSTSTRRESRIGSPCGNSSAITVTVAPADFPIPSARCPAERPMATTRYQRWVVMASVMRLFTSWTPTLRAVSNPNVGTPPGSGRSLSMVLGTWATRSDPPAVSASLDAENAVSSPPMVTSASTSSLPRDSRQACSRQSGSALDVDPRHVGDRQRPDLVGPPVQQMLEAVHDPEDVPAGVPCLDRGGGDDGVHSGSRSAAAEDPQTHADHGSSAAPAPQTGPGQGAASRPGRGFDANPRPRLDSALVPEAGQILSFNLRS